MKEPVLYLLFETESPPPPGYTSHHHFHTIFVPNFYSIIIIIIFTICHTSCTSIVYTIPKPSCHTIPTTIFQCICLPSPFQSPLFQIPPKLPTQILVISTLAPISSGIVDRLGPDPNVGMLSCTSSRLQIAAQSSPSGPSIVIHIIT